MKIAVSIPDVIYAEAEEFAKRSGRSRSGVYAQALREYLDRHNANAIEDAINRLADEGMLELDPFVAANSNVILRNTEW